MNKPDSTDSVKNFGLNKWNDSWVENEEDVALVENINPFEGTAEESDREVKSNFYDAIWKRINKSDYPHIREKEYVD